MSCRKRRFRSKLEAMIALSRIEFGESRHRKHGRVTEREETRVYRCPDCSGWHLTSARG